MDERLTIRRDVASGEEGGDLLGGLVASGSGGKGDVEGGSGFLLSLYERKSRIGKLYKLSGKQSEDVAVGIVITLRDFDVKTITYDNGLEFAKHGFVNDLLGSESYFCKPYSSWEKGGVENYNGLVRQYFPKGSDFSGITQEQLQEVEDEINNRPRNILG
ncbi:IS30 family transposase, partial [Akkermansiaceae bacterium]|nr:IS30 family transposase [Akkermansiaceae bacterium]